MNGSPRPSGAFPATPQRPTRSQNAYPTPNGANFRASTVAPDAQKAQLPEQGPLIPLETLDAASQRFYAAGFWFCLLCYRLYDFYNLTIDDTESFWHFLKWIAIDGVFLFGLPGLRIPWLEWSTWTMTSIFLVHALFDGMLMFRIGIPFQTALFALTKVLYDRETALSEVRVNPATILQNDSLILGRQIIHILPEGSAVLDPAKGPHCIGKDKSSILLPIQINQTTPILIELARLDLNTNEQETITISKPKVKKMHKAANKAEPHLGPDDPRILKYEVQKPGRYTLQRVVDESNLEVQTRRSEALVVSCPKAQLSPSSMDRCKGEVSDVALQIEGTPPLRLKYRKTVNGREIEQNIQSVQPDDFTSPLIRQDDNSLVPAGQPDVSWARSRQVLVALNETLSQAGYWTYSLEEVRDALGNSVLYTVEDEQIGQRTEALPELNKVLVVHDRPNVKLQSNEPRKMARGQKISMPLNFGSTARHALKETRHALKYHFTPEEQIQAAGGHPKGHETTTQQVELKSYDSNVVLDKPGFYSLEHVESEFCSGEVLEPASFRLEVPPEPNLQIESHDITDRCAGNPIGLEVDLSLTGSPPFLVKYTSQRKNSRDVDRYEVSVPGHTRQVQLKPKTAGHYTYTFYEVSDDVYKEFSVRRMNLVLEQNVKPAASASFIDAQKGKQFCIGQSATFNIRLKGESPWILEYELVHGGKRDKKTIEKIENDVYEIKTPELRDGGQYTLALLAVTDTTGCRENLEEETTINVRQQIPKAGFGHIEGSRSVKIIQGKDVQLPIRLAGEGPWTVTWISSEHPDKANVAERTDANSFISASQQGIYELTRVADQCPGEVDEKDKQFAVEWIPRPAINVSQISVVSKMAENNYKKADICEGDEDSLDVLFTGAPPFTVRYKEQHKRTKGFREGFSLKELNGALGTASIRMDTSISGDFEYQFHEPSDANYNSNSKEPDALVVSQHVNSRPTAVFESPGKTYSYCSSDTQDTGGEQIPVVLSGTAPFYLEVEIKQQGPSKPQILNFANIPSNSHNIHIPHSYIRSGQYGLTIRKVRDAHTCTRKYDTTPSYNTRDTSTSASRVQIAVYDAPTITYLEARSDFCVGDRISFSLSGQQPFNVFYTFDGAERKASVSGNTFRRITERPGIFHITALSDSASSCRAPVDISQTIHALPSVRVSKGKEARTDIHEGGEAEILFEFGGDPPFEFTFVRMENLKKGSTRKPAVLESVTLRSEERELRTKASEEGTYEVVAVRDRWCSYARAGAEGKGFGGKLLKN
ncbi:MAG: hypothetical protein M1820_008258 [Bogoriella megaspora]|nr:MAG: hypothetical protein M1820_008258 [Bogoriella megaspora]